MFYSRDDQDGPKLSDYSIARISKPDELLVTLGQALGIRGEVSVLKFGTRLKSAVLKPTFLLLGLSQLENVD